MSNTQDQSARDSRDTTADTGPAAGQAGAGTAAGTAGGARAYVPRQSSGYESAAATEPSGAVRGFTMTAAILMMVGGAIGVFEGLAAILSNSHFYVVNANYGFVHANYVFDTSVTSWGWIHLALGAVMFAAGLFLLADMMWARIAGVVVASFSALANFLFIPYYPVWSLLIIALDVVIIWALLSPRRGEGW
jgi:hypothetical protein